MQLVAKAASFVRFVRDRNWCVESIFWNRRPAEWSGMLGNNLRTIKPNIAKEDNKIQHDTRRHGYVTGVHTLSSASRHANLELYFSNMHSIAAVQKASGLLLDLLV